MKDPIIEAAMKLSAEMPLVTTIFSRGSVSADKPDVVYFAWKLRYAGKQYGMYTELDWTKPEDVTAEAIADLHTQTLENIHRTIEALATEAAKEEKDNG